MTVHINNILRIDREDIEKTFVPLPHRSNKGDCGRVLLVCGSYDPCGSAMSGAVYFAAAAAYRTGAGIVEIFTPRENYSSLAANIPEAVFSLYGLDESFDCVYKRLENKIDAADSIVVGCGLGQSDMSREILKRVMLRASCPMLIDADALNIISEDKSLWGLMSDEQRAQTLITPHPGEMSRLCKLSIGEILQDTVGAASSFAKEFGIVCLLKDHQTVISDGAAVYLNHTGNAGMATAGMGDLLAGIIGALLARASKTGDSDILRRAALGAYIHGLCGDLAKAEIGEYSMIASDLIDQIPRAISV